MSNSAPAYPLSSVDNALRLLTLLHVRGSLRVAEAAAELGVAASTAHRLLAMLRARGFAEQDGSRAYRPGPALVGLASVGSPRPDLSTAAHGPLAALARTTGETTHLVVLEGNGVRFVDGVDGEQPLRVGSRVGVLLPAHATSGGKALLAELAPEELRALYAAGLPTTRAGAVRDLAALRRELGRVRRQGFALNLEESERGVNAVGTCVRSASGAAVAAAVVAAPAARCGRRELLELTVPLLETARKVSASL